MAISYLISVGRNAPCPCGSGNKYKRCCVGRSTPVPSSSSRVPDAPLGWPTFFACVVLIILGGFWAYHNSFHGPFIFDDKTSILTNSRLHSLWPLGPLLIGTPRPLVDVSFALNYAWGGLRVEGYHVVNVLIHLLAGLTLFGIVRRTCRNEWLAFAASLVWVIHPLNTQSVTYLSQRAESMMGLSYLLTLYAVIRGSMSPRAGRWYVIAVIACACGMLSKPIMATAPLLVWLYDRIFLAKSFREALRRRAALYAGLAATWGLLALVITTSPDMSQNAGFGLKGMAPLEYAASQPGVLFHYIRLSLWPTNLCLDYTWHMARAVDEILWPSLGIVALLGLTLYGLRRLPAVGFLGAWFFLILAPSSSVIPLADLAFEHRMYLPLAAVVLLAVLGLSWILQRLITSEILRNRVAGGLLVLAVGVLGSLTLQRNAQYRTALAIWGDTVAKQPHNARAHLNVGLAFAEAGQLNDAIAHYRQTLALDPHDLEAHNNLGNALSSLNEYDEAISHLSKALELNPTDAEVHNNLGNTFARHGRLDEAILHYREALRLEPHLAEGEFNLAAALDSQGKLQEAMPHFRKALHLRPDFPEAYAYFARVVPATAQAREPEAILAQYAHARQQSQRMIVTPGEALSMSDLQARLKTQPR